MLIISTFNIYGPQFPINYNITLLKLLKSFKREAWIIEFQNNF